LDYRERVVNPPNFLRAFIYGFKITLGFIIFSGSLFLSIVPIKSKIITNDGRKIFRLGLFWNKGGRSVEK